MSRQIHALIFDLAGGKQLIVWHDRPCKIARPERQCRWMEVRKGDRLLMDGKPHDVLSVRPFRAVPIQDAYDEVGCGMDWLAGA